MADEGKLGLWIVSIFLGTKEGEPIQLKVKNAEGKEVTFKLKMTTPLRKVSEFVLFLYIF